MHTKPHTFIKRLGVVLISGKKIALRFPLLNLSIPLMLIADKNGENNMLCCLA